jgi:DNA-binding HxlR family transcriptional regulator
MAYAAGMGQRRSSAARVAQSQPASAARFPTPEAAARAVEEALRLIKGRWKLLILFNLFGGRVRRFSELERAIPGVSQKMLTQQLRQLETAGLIRRVIYPEVPPKVEYALTNWGQALCPVLDALLQWLPDRVASSPADGTGARQFDRLLTPASQARPR